MVFQAITCCGLCMVHVFCRLLWQSPRGVQSPLPTCCTLKSPHGNTIAACTCCAARAPRRELARRVEQFVLRRTREVNARYLPPLTNYVVFCR